jgi:tocopherol cyclase
MEHNAPHKNAAFEGYYSKFDLPSGAHIALIVCKVHVAKFRPNKVSFTYVPQDVSQIYQKELFPDEMEMKTLGPDNAFEITIPDVGFVRWHGKSITEYDINDESFTFQGKTSTRTPWSRTARFNTPENLLVYLPLPLHWHVHSLASECTYSLSIPGHNLPPTLASNNAIVHQEKNWAASFPSAHMWIQARSGDKSFCCAGGQILGMEAFLLGYRSKSLEVDFRPPFALRVAGLSPFMTYTTDWENRKFSLSVQSFRQKVTVEARAPAGTFFSLSAPFREGHLPNPLGESFQATIRVKVWDSEWVGEWRLVEEVFEGGSLEFGAGYYPPRGSDERFH